MHRATINLAHLTAIASFVAAALAAPTVAHAQVHGHGEGRMHPAIRIPESMRVEHAEIHAELVQATKRPGEVGAAARALADVLHPHFQREEQIALPPLGLLTPLARGEASAEMRAVLPLTDSLRAELPRMLQEHVAIRAATVRMGEVARAHGDEAVAHLAEKLKIHAQNEEEVSYPTAILVGDVVRARTKAPDPER